MTLAISVTENLEFCAEKASHRRHMNRVVPPRTMPDLVLRDATLADIDDLALLETRSFDGDRLSRRSLRRLAVAPSAALRVARDKDALAGYALLLFRAGSRLARLYSIAVDPAARGSGLGGKLLRDAEMTAAKRGSTGLRLEVRADNAAAIGLYRRRGYEPDGTRANYYADGATALRFVKRLGGGARPATGKR
jgi:ribosomal protein S18 acetylase RimI-like enzyme